MNKTFQRRCEIIAKDLGEFLAVEFLNEYFERYGSKSCPTRSQIGMMLTTHPKIQSYHFGTHANIDGIRGDVRRYFYIG